MTQLVVVLDEILDKVYDLDWESFGVCVDDGGHIEVNLNVKLPLQLLIGDVEPNRVNRY